MNTINFYTFMIQKRISNKDRTITKRVTVISPIILDNKMMKKKKIIIYRTLLIKIIKIIKIRIVYKIIILLMKVSMIIKKIKNILNKINKIFLIHIMMTILKLILNKNKYRMMKI
jgi:hypothetical protein